MHALLALGLVTTLAESGSAGAAALPSILDSQELADGLDLALPEEAEAYGKLGSDAARRRFRTLFWTRRDPDPETFGNGVRETMLRRAREADQRFGTTKVAGRKTDAGIVYVILGPAAREEKAARGLRLHYAPDASRVIPEALEIAFEDRAGSGMVFSDPEAAARILGRARAALVQSPSVQYADVPRSLPAPDVSGIEWQELMTARDRYRREGRRPDFTIPGTLNVVRAGKGRSNVYLDIDVAGAEVVRDKAGAGNERHVTVAGLVESADLGVAVPIRDLAVLRSPADAVHLRLSFELQPGRYRITLAAREPLLSLLSFREETFTVPDQDVGLTSSSLIAGHEAPPERAGSDLPLDLRAGGLVMEPSPSPTSVAMVHVHGASKPVDVRFQAAGAEVEVTRWWRVGEGPRQTVAAAFAAPVTAPLVAIVRDPGTGRGLVLCRDKGDPEERPLASRRALLADLPLAASAAPVTLSEPAPSANPISVTRAVAARDGEGAVGFFSGGELLGFATAPPWQWPLSFEGGPSLDVAVAALEGTASGILARGVPQGVELPSRTAAFRVRTTLVPVYAAVEDRKRQRFVTGLAREAFAVTEDGRPQTLEHFEAETADPITVALVLDESRFMAPFQDKARAALADFASRLRPIDRGLVVGFNRHVALRADITGCKGCLVASILGSEHVPPDREIAERAAAAEAPAAAPEASSPIVSQDNPSGRLMDALEATVFRLAPRTGRKIVLVASHGSDSGSRIGADRIADLARRYGVMVYPIGVNINPGAGAEGMKLITTDPSTAEKVLKAAGLGVFYAEKDHKKHQAEDQWESRLRTPATLEALAGASGGRAYLYDATAGAPLDFQAAVRALGNELAHQYFLGFTAEETGGKGLREIRMTVPGKDYVVRGRTAYVPQ